MTDTSVALPDEYVALRDAHTQAAWLLGNSGFHIDNETDATRKRLDAYILTLLARAEWAEGERDEWKGEATQQSSDFERLRAANEGLARENEALAKDAARYRWLRDTDHWRLPTERDSKFSGTVIRGVKCANWHDGICNHTDWLDLAELDAVIDAALASTGDAGRDSHE